MAILACQLVLLIRTNQTLFLPVDPLQEQAVLMPLGQTTLEQNSANIPLSFSKNVSAGYEIEWIILPDGRRRVREQIG